MMKAFDSSNWRIFYVLGLFLSAGTLVAQVAITSGDSRIPYGIGIWAEDEGEARVTYASPSLSAFSLVAQQNHQDQLNLIDLEIDVIDGLPLYAGVFNKGQLPQVFLTGLSAAAMLTTQTQMETQGYQIVDIETYILAGHRYFAAVWHQSSTFHNTLHLHMSKRLLAANNISQELLGEGLDDLEAWVEGGLAVYAGIWSSKVGTRLYDAGQLWHDFVDLTARRVEDGWYLMDVDTYSRGNLTYYIGVWGQERRTVFLMGNCYETVLTLEQASGAGWALIDFERVREQEYLDPVQGSGPCGEDFPPPWTGPDSFKYYCPTCLAHKAVSIPDCAPVPGPQGEICF